MVKTLSKSMVKTLNEIKEFAVDNMGNSSNGDMITIRKKPTKKKEFRALISYFHKPSFQLFINNKFFAGYFYTPSSKTWEEIRN